MTTNHITAEPCFVDRVAGALMTGLSVAAMLAFVVVVMAMAGG